MVSHAETTTKLLKSTYIEIQRFVRCLIYVVYCGLLAEVRTSIVAFCILLAVDFIYILQDYSISHEICTRSCCALLCCGYAIVHNEFT